MKSIMLIMVLLVITFGNSIAQENFQALYKNHTLRLNWDYDTTGTIKEYYIFAIRGNDTTQFRTVGKFYEGAKYDTVWALQIGSTLYNYFHFELHNISYANWLKFGIMGVGYGETSDSLITTPAIRWRKPVLPTTIKVD